MVASQIRLYCLRCSEVCALWEVAIPGMGAGISDPASCRPTQGRLSLLWLGRGKHTACQARCMPGSLYTHCESGPVRCRMTGVQKTMRDQKAMHVDMPHLGHAQQRRMYGWDSSPRRPQGTSAHCWHRRSLASRRRACTLMILLQTFICSRWTFVVRLACRPHPTSTSFAENVFPFSVHCALTLHDAPACGDLRRAFPAILCIFARVHCGLPVTQDHSDHLQPFRQGPHAGNMCRPCSALSACGSYG